MFWIIKYTQSDKLGQLTDVHFGSKEYDFDQINIHVGMFGVPGFMFWHCKPDKPIMIEIGSHLTLTLFNDGGDIQLCQDYLIHSAFYNPKIFQYEIYGIEQTWYNLSADTNHPLHEFTSNKDEPRTPYKVIQKIVARQNIAVSFLGEVDLKEGYVSLPFDSSHSSLDIITKICYDNNWEFCIMTGEVFIGQPFWMEIQAKGGEHDKESVKSIRSGLFTTTLVKAHGADPGFLWDEERIVWVEYWVGGQIGGQCNVCTYASLLNPLTEELYCETLTGWARTLALERKRNNFKTDSLLLGKMYGSFINERMDKYEAPMFIGAVDNPTKDPFSKTFRADAEAKKLQPLQTKFTMMTTPYAGDGVGLVFPQDDSYRVLFTPDGDREMALIGPAYFHRDHPPPKRSNVKDFRLQLPNGWCLYVKEDGDTYLQMADTEATSAPSEDTSKVFLHFNINGSVKINQGSGNWIEIDSSGNITLDGSTIKLQGGGNKLSHGDHTHGYQHLHTTGNMAMPIPPQQHIGLGIDTATHLPNQGTTTTEAE